MPLRAFTCQQCDIPFERVVANTRTARFCSRSCTTTWNMAHGPQSTSSRIERVIESNQRRKGESRPKGTHKAPHLSALNAIPGRSAEIGRNSAAKRGDAQRGKGQGKTYRKHSGRHEHRKVMEEKIGRLLSSNEIVHHKDHDKFNNSPENLEIMTRAEHARHHFHGK